MKLYKSTSTLLLIALLLIGCVGNEKQPANQTKTEIPTTNSSQSNTSGQVLRDFQAEVENLRENLKKENSKIDLSSYKNQYNKVEEIIQKSDFLLSDDRSVLKEISKFKEFDPKEKNPSEAIKTLQKKIDPGGSTDGLYGVDLGNKLSDRLEKINIPIASDSDGQVENSSSASSLDNKSQNWLIFPAVFGAALSILSVAANVFTYRLIKQSNTCFKELEKKMRENKDELRKWATNVDKNIKTLSSQQSEIDRKLQQQRQAAKVVDYSNSPQSYGREEQVEYGEVFNSPSAQNPYGSPDRQAYAGSDYAQRVYQAPQSPHEMIAQQFNTNPNAIATSAQGVSETEDSIYRRRRDSSVKQVTLQTISNYSYWIISDAEGGYWLTPIAELKLNPMNFDTFQALFQFSGEFTGKLQLIKPAKVTQASTGQWELIEPGDVQFI